MTTLTIGVLDKCPDCNRRKREPGAEYCPDCTIMERLHKSHSFEISHLIDNWGDPDFPYTPMARLQDNADFQSYATVGEFFRECRNWEDRNRPKIYQSAGRCPECGQVIHD